MAALSGGHLATDFASGSVPGPAAVLRGEVRSLLHAHGGPDAGRALLVLARRSRFSGSGRIAAARSGCCPAVSRSRGRDSASRRSPRATRLLVVLVFLAGHRDRRVSSRGSEVRGVRERPQACERDVAVQHRRQHRLCARPDHRDPARPLARARAGWMLASIPVVLCSLAVLAALPYLATPRARSGEREARRRKARTTCGRWCSSAA